MAFVFLDLERRQGGIIVVLVVLSEYFFLENFQKKLNCQYSVHIIHISESEIHFVSFVIRTYVNTTMGRRQRQTCDAREFARK